MSTIRNATYTYTASHVAQTVANLKDLFSATNGDGLGESRPQPESFRMSCFLIILVFCIVRNKFENILDNLTEIERHYGCDKTKMFLPSSDVKTKKLCCMYCRIQYPKLARHLRFVHKNESAVKKFLAFPPGKFFSCYRNGSPAANSEHSSGCINIRVTKFR